MALYYRTYRSYLKKRFGKPILKIPLNGGFSCPNRDGTISSRGCSFCDNQSFSPVALTARSVIEQLTTAMKKGSSRYELFMAYLQPFSNTYGSIDYLKTIYEPLIAIPRVMGLAIGTRPDCLSGEIVEYLSALSEKTYLCIELGLQSTSNETLALNNRGHTYADFEKAVLHLSRCGIETVAHVMLGLPGDTRETMLDTARKLAGLPVAGIKIHQLMIIRGTPAEQWYAQGTLTPLSIEQYANLAGEFVKTLRPDQYIHRLMADSKPEHGLIAPLWSAEKMKSLNLIKKIMKEGWCVEQKSDI